MARNGELEGFDCFASTVLILILVWAFWDSEADDLYEDMRPQEQAIYRPIYDSELDEKFYIKGMRIAAKGDTCAALSVMQDERTILEEKGLDYGHPLDTFNSIFHDSLKSHCSTHHSDEAEAARALAEAEAKAIETAKPIYDDTKASLHMYRMATDSSNGCPKAMDILDALSFKSSITIPQVQGGSCGYRVLQ